MTKDEEFELEKRWIELERRSKDLDFAKSQWARDARARFARGAHGDTLFVEWCVARIGVTMFLAREELLTRAVAASVVPDEKTWKQIGGLKAIRPVHSLPRNVQVTVLEAAKAQGKAPINVMRERGLLPKPVVEAPKAVPPPRPAPVVPLPALVSKDDARKDAEFLAKFIIDNHKSIPLDVLRVVSRYASVSAVIRRKAA